MTTGKNNKRINIDAETSRDFLMTDDYNDSERVDDEEESEYFDQYGDESNSSDESMSNVSNAFKEYQEMLGDQKHVQNHLGHYVLFIDPDSFLYYRKDLRRNDYLLLEPF